MTTIAYGSKHAQTKDFDIREIAKLVRRDLKAEQQAGRLRSDIRISVRIERFAYGQSLKARLTWLDKTTDGLFETLRRDDDETGATIARIIAAYNFDGSDLQSDHFNVRFYAQVSVGGTLV